MEGFLSKHLALKVDVTGAEGKEENKKGENLQARSVHFSAQAVAVKGLTLRN